MPKVLKADYAIYKESDGIYLQHADKSGPRIDLHPLTASVIALLNGRREDAEVVRIMAEGFNLNKDKGEVLLNGILKRFRQCIWEREEASLGGDNPNERLRPQDYMFKPKKQYNPDRLPAPIRLNWYVTHHCNRRCAYCYMGAPYCQEAKDSTLTTAQVKRIIDEAADIGVCGMMFTGGEPMLRADSVELAEYVLNKHMSLYVITKMGLSEDDILRLKHDNMRLELSLDTIYQKTADLLTGTRGFYQDMMKNISLCVKHDMPITVASTITALNTDQAVETVTALHDLGVKSIKLSKYGVSEGRHSDKFLVASDVWRQIRQQVEAVQQEIGDPDFEVSWNEESCNSVEKAFSSKDQPFQWPCAIGRSILMFRYDGKVSWCERLQDNDKWVYGDLTKQSIMEVWESEELRRFLNPEREKFAGTVCHSCDLFDACTGKTGCMVVSHLKYGEYFTPLPKYTEVCGSGTTNPRPE